MQRNATAQWRGALKTGKGSISSDSGVLSETPFSFGTRFEGAQGTNPEELIAAAHAGCFSMALSMMLGQQDLEPEKVDTRASLTLDQVEGGFAVTAIHLDVTAKVTGADQAAFDKAANDAKAGCPVSKVLDTEITMEAKLEN
jgi:osmotically inducible protein OsmC